MKAPRLSLEEVTSFGILPEDEGPHPYDPDVEWWNESWFWDFFDSDGTAAGHCRIGLHPVQRRVWFWFFLYQDGEWIVLEEPHLPLADIQFPRLAYRGRGLEFSWDPSEALRLGHLRVHGFGRVISGPRVGQIQELGADLEISAIGAAHTTGRNDVAGHRSEGFDACRFEQPIALQGELMAGGHTSSFEGRGERDHSWGPRAWNMEWTIVIGNRADMRFMCTDVRIPGIDPIKVGYLHTKHTENLSDVEFDLEYDDDAPLSPVAGSVAITTAGSQKLTFRLEAISGAEINLTHVLDPPRRPIYRRALIRLHPEDGSEPFIGWHESHRAAEPA